MIKVKVVLLLILFSNLLSASLQYLEKNIVNKTAFESVNNDFINDYHSSSKDYDDAVDKDVDIGFIFPFNGTTYTKVNINSNGVLYFVNKNDAAYNNKELPNNNLEQSIYPYWDDLDLGNTNDGKQGKITYGTIGNGDDIHFVVHWDRVWRYGDSNKRYSIEIVLYKDGSIRFRYDANSDTDGTSATIGVQEDISHYDQHSYNSQIDATKDILYTPKDDTPPTDNDYSDFHFDELSWNGTANEVKDSHWDNDGVAYNVKSIRGKICQAMDLSANSANDYAILGAKALDGVTNFTISIWHKGKSGDDSNALLSSANSNEDNEILFWMSNDTTFRGHLKNKQNNVSSPNINDNSWHHLVWRVENKQSCYFFDGVKQGCKDYTYSPSKLVVEGLILGQDQDKVGGNFDLNQDWEGIVDELLIFRKALSDSEIQSIYNNQNAGRNWDGTERICPYPTITKSSCVINDLVNNATKPKRIPGATIRFAIEVENKNSSNIDNVIVKDSLNDNLDTSTIKNLQIKEGSCDCLGVSGASNNGSNGSNNGENPVRLDYGTLNGSTKKCGYFEVEIK